MDIQAHAFLRECVGFFIALCQMPATIAAPSMSSATSSGSFPEEQFVNIPDVPVFAEHETEHKGRVMQFGPNELQAVVNRCNQRIASTGDYAVLCIGHTPSAEARERGVPSPPAIGFAGPFKLGEEQDEQGNTRYVILADWHVYREDYDQVRKHPRRSAELWVEDAYEDMFLDPIALLGSEPPRLDMGNLYQRHQRSGREVLKYSYTMPGSGNSFVPGEVKRHSATEGNQMDGNPQDMIAQIVDAITQTPQWKFLETLMQEQQGAGDTSGTESSPADDLTAAGPDPMADPVAPPTPAEPSLAAPPAAPAPDPAAGAGGMEPTPEAPVDEEIVDPAEREKMQRYEALDEATEDMSDEEVAEYAAGRHKRRRRRKGYEAACETMDDESVEATDNKWSYAKQGDRALYSRVKDLEAKLLEERSIRIDEQRRSKLNQLKSSGILLDVDEEMDRLKFSKVESNDKFKAELGRIQKNYNRLPTAIDFLPELLDEAPSDPARYSRDNEKQCVEARNMALKQNIKFEDALQQLRGKSA